MNNWDNDWNGNTGSNSWDSAEGGAWNAPDNMGYSMEENTADNGNYESAYQYAYSVQMEENRVQSVMTKSFLFMFVALCISAMAAQYAITSGLFIQFIVNRGLFMGLLVAEIAVVFIANLCLNKKLLVPSVILFVAYSVINGLTLSIVLLAYTASSVVSVFMIAALVFGIMAIFGAVTKKNLTSLGSIGLMLLIGIILISVINLVILKSSGLDLVLSGLGLAVFIGLTAYDTQKIKEMAMVNGNDSSTILGVAGALTLYLDFINIFLKLLRLFGERD